MPPASTQLDINVNVSVSKRFIKDSDVKNILLGKYDWNTPKLQFKGKTVGRSNVGNHVMYDVILDEVPAVTMKLKQGCLKYLSPGASASTTEEPNEPSNLPVVSEDLLDDAIQSEEEEEEEIDLTPGDGWTSGEVFVDSRLCSESYRQSSSKLNMENQRYESPLSYFLFFLPHEQIHRIIGSTNSHARNVDASWRDINYNEYMMWLALLTVMTVIRHSDRKAYWKQGSSHFTMSIDFRRYMSFNRFEEIMQMHTFEIPTIEKQQNDPLYQIRATITAFNEHMASCIVPGKYLVVDESMNQWLGIGMPNLKKVPRKPHPIGQEFKTLADHHSYCILQMDTVSDPVSKEYDNEPGMKKLTATIKRLVKPWFGSGRTVIADSWFGSPDMTAMLSDLGLYSIMQVTKRRYWPRGMPVTDIVEQLEPAHGSHYTMKKNSGSGTMFVCSYRDRRVKAFISSCGTTSRLGGQRTSVSSGSLEVAVSRPNVVNEYETHKSK